MSFAKSRSIFLPMNIIFASQIFFKNYVLVFNLDRHSHVHHYWSLFNLILLQKFDCTIRSICKSRVGCTSLKISNKSIISLSSTFNGVEKDDLTISQWTKWSSINYLTLNHSLISSYACQILDSFCCSHQSKASPVNLNET